MNLNLSTKVDVRLLVDQTLDNFFKESITQARLIDDSYATLWSELYRLIRSGGKRLRPQMVVMAYEAFGGTDTDLIIPVASAHEVLHFSLLVHDDIIDRDTERYGTANMNGSFDTIYAPFVTEATDRKHYANSAALLGGDVMIMAAYKLITDSQLADDDKVTAYRLINQALFDVTAGELLDTESAFKPYASTDAIKIARFKTASYSFVSPLVTGASLAAATEADQIILAELADSLGTAYQLSDDLLGVFGDRSVTGKTTSGDIREGKRTYMIECLLQTVTNEQRLFFTNHFGQADSTESDYQAIRQMIIDTGTKQKVEQTIEAYKARAIHALRKLRFEKSVDDQFLRLIHTVTDRAF